LKWRDPPASVTRDGGDHAPAAAATKALSFAGNMTAATVSLPAVAVAADQSMSLSSSLSLSSSPSMSSPFIIPGVGLAARLRKKGDSPIAILIANAPHCDKTKKEVRKLDRGRVPVESSSSRSGAPAGSKKHTASSKSSSKKTSTAKSSSSSSTGTKRRSTRSK
jgi:hypothetical protein